MNRVFSLFLLVCAAYLQAFRLLEIGGVNPGLAATALIAFAFFESDVFITMLAVAVSALFLSSTPAANIEDIVFILTVSAAIIFKNLFFWKSLIHYFILIFCWTLAFYLLVAWNFVLSNPGIVLGEELYNMAVGLVFFCLFSLVYGDKKF